MMKMQFELMEEDNDKTLPKHRQDMEGVRR